MAGEPDNEEEAFVTELRNGVLWLQWRQNMSVSDTDAAALVQRADALCWNVCPPMLVVLNGMVTLSRNALSTFAHTLNISAMAVVGPSAVDRTLTDYFTEVHRPPYPTRYYGNTDDALAWLTDHPYG